MVKLARLAENGPDLKALADAAEKAEQDVGKWSRDNPQYWSKPIKIEYVKGTNNTEPWSTTGC